MLVALDATVASGSYDIRSELHVEPATSSANVCEDVRPPPNASSWKCVAVGARPVDVRSHGTVNLDPYKLMAVSEVTGLGVITLYANSTTVWEHGGGNYGAAV